MPKKQPVQQGLHRGMNSEEWMNYISQPLEREPKTLDDMTSQAMAAGTRSTIFGFVLFGRALRMTFKMLKKIISLLRSVYRMLGRGKKKEVVNDAEQLASLARGQPMAGGSPPPAAIYRQPAPPAPVYPPRPEMPTRPLTPQELYAMQTREYNRAMAAAGAQPAYPAPPSQPAYPEPPVYAPEPPAQPALPAPQSYPEPEMLVNPLSTIARALAVLDQRITLIEEAVDQLITRMNMVQGVQPMPKRSVSFTKYKGT